MTRCADSELGPYLGATVTHHHYRPAELLQHGASAQRGSGSGDVNWADVDATGVVAVCCIPLVGQEQILA
ncbi:MAG: hypothetical protein AAB289_02635, partial [Chloroflexota bacterium]